MKLKMLTATLMLAMSVSTAWAKPFVEIKTNKGTMLVELYPEKAPKTVDNFLQYVTSHHYDGTIFHRVITNFMIQGGGMDKDLNERPTRPPIRNEADNGLTNSFASIAMARTGDPHSATSQFYINVANNTSLNHSEKSDRGWGYCVFGKVVKGMEVAEHISHLPTDGGDLPIQTILIEYIKVVEDKKP